MFQSLRSLVAVAVVGMSLLGSSWVASARRVERSSEQTVTTTHSVTAPDGTTTIVEEVTVTKDGHSTTTKQTRVIAAGASPAEVAPATAAPLAVPKVALSGTALESEALAAHNRERQRVGVGPLRWDAELQAVAAEWASHLCHDGKGPAYLQHRPRGPGVPGENLWEGVSSEPQGYSVTDAVQSWAAERRYYDTRSGRCRGGVCGHYTQLVWQQSTTVGCAAATCPNRGMAATVWVCNYRPSGNVIGDKPY